MSGKGMAPRKGYNWAKYADNYDGIFRKQPTKELMKTTKIKANLVNLPLIGCPGAEGASWALPADAESYERMVEQIAKAVCKMVSNVAWKDCSDWAKTHYRACAETDLYAIGITPRTGRGGKGKQ